MPPFCEWNYLIRIIKTSNIIPPCIYDLPLWCNSLRDKEFVHVWFWSRNFIIQVSILKKKKIRQIYIGRNCKTEIKSQSNRTCIYSIQLVHVKKTIDNYRYSHYINCDRNKKRKTSIYEYMLKRRISEMCVYRIYEVSTLKL